MASAAQLPSPLPLGELIRSAPIAVFLDFDGTLVDIAPSPDAIAVPAGLADRLAALAAQLEGRMALVSGRGIDDLERHLGPLALACAGSHGAARRHADGAWLGERPTPLDDEIVARVAAFAIEHGVHHEPKPHGAALHSRATPQREEACSQFMETLAADYGLAVKRGKFVAELVRPNADKGAAVRAFMRETPFTGSRPIFVGDDVTDEDGFAAVIDHGGLAIAVGPRDSRLATFGLADPPAVRDWLGL